MEQFQTLSLKEHLVVDVDVASKYLIQICFSNEFIILFLLFSGVSREKRDLKVVISIAIKYAIDSRCNNGPCLATLRSKLITKLQKAGNIANFPCQIQTVDENNATVTKNFNIAATFLGFLDSSK